MGDYLAFDLETENHRHLGRLANPFCDKNYVVASGWKTGKGKVEHLYSLNKEDDKLPTPLHDEDSDITLLVGFNIKFDLLYFWRHPKMISFLKRGGRIWCCQLAEYLLNGMTPMDKMLSMDKVAPKYGGEKKIDAVKEMWNEGKLTSEIPKDLLLEYLCDIGDVPNTEKIFLGQLKRAKKLGMLKMIMTRMESLLCTTEMEYNGLFINRSVAKTNAKELVQHINTARDTIMKYVDVPDYMNFNIASGQQMSCLLYGGTIKSVIKVYKRDEEGNRLYTKRDMKKEIVNEHGETVYYKSGKRKGEIKYRNVKVDDLTKPKTGNKTVFSTLPRLFEPPPGSQLKDCDAKGVHIFSTDATTIDKLISLNQGNDLLLAFKNYQQYKKDLSTYYLSKGANGKFKGMLTNVGDDSIIHHNLNHTTTVTGRLSSSNPNMQTMPKKSKSKVKQMFTSRFDGGKMIEVDYSQLEVVVQGLLTEDKQLVDDLNDRIDFHCKRLAAKLKEDYNDVLVKAKNEDHPEYATYNKQRTDAKVFSFQLAYGAGATTISANTGLPLEDVYSLIETNNKLYPGINRFNDLVAKTVDQDSIDNNKIMFNRTLGRSIRYGSFVTPTKTTYTFFQCDAPDFLKKKGIHSSFSPTQMKNYPIQGMGGELVQLQLGKLFRHFLHKDNYNGNALLVNTVHDCVWADTSNSTEASSKEIALDIKNTLQQIPQSLKEIYDWDINVSFPADAEYGDDMYNLHEVN